MASSLLSSLPAPSKAYTGPVAPAAPAANSSASALAKEAPPYMKRAGFVPRRPEDFAGGGAFPEIHVAQYPLDMGKPGAARGAQTLAVSVNASGQVAYDALLQQGSHKGKVIHAEHMALVPKVDRVLGEGLARPDEEEVAATAAATQAALDRVLNRKLGQANPTNLPDQPGGPTYIKYTPAQQGPAYASGAGQRIIKMQDLPVDPLEPPKFRHVKVPRGPGSPPVPVMHSPPRSVSTADVANWKIPPSISNWKNPKGYTIPLDKRLAADGRGLQQSVINDKFAGLSEALFMAEAKAREAIAMRATVQKELAAKEKARKEAELRELAMRARMERAGGVAVGAAAGTAAAAAGFGSSATAGSGLAPSAPHAYGSAGGGADERLPPPPPLPFPPGGGDRARVEAGGVAGDSSDDEHDKEETAAERAARRARDEIREERRRERERERRLESRDAHGAKKSKLTRDRDRDVSEKIALGMARVAGGGEVAYDQRLFNQDQGMASGFGADDSYGVYDKPLFVDRSAAGGLHRPRAPAEDEDDQAGEGAGGAIRTDKFRADKGFAGAEGGQGAGGARGGGPVEFARAGGEGGRAAAAAAEEEEEADPFGLDAFLTDVKKGGGGGRR